MPNSITIIHKSVVVLLGVTFKGDVQTYDFLVKNQRVIYWELWTVAFSLTVVVECYCVKQETLRSVGIANVPKN